MVGRAFKLFFSLQHKIMFNFCLFTSQFLASGFEFRISVRIFGTGKFQLASLQSMKQLLKCIFYGLILEILGNKIAKFISLIGIRNILSLGIQVLNLFLWLQKFLILHVIQLNNPPSPQVCLTFNKKLLEPAKIL